MSHSFESICHAVECDLSALIDGELQDIDLRRALDHLADCGSCRAFYRQARMLEDVVQSDALEPGDPPPELWSRIAAEAGLADGASERPASVRRPNRVWAAVAAILMLVTGMLLLRSTDGALPGESLEIVLGEKRGQMDEARFIALTAELLRADRRYQRKMLEVMLTVDEHLDHLEFSDEDVPPRHEGRETRSDREDSSRV